METIPPIKMVMTGVWLIIVLTTLGSFGCVMIVGIYIYVCMYWNMMFLELLIFHRFPSISPYIAGIVAMLLCHYGWLRNRAALGRWLLLTSQNVPTRYL
jgi:hypothetical protein